MGYSLKRGANTDKTDTCRFFFLREGGVGDGKGGAIAD